MVMLHYRTLQIMLGYDVLIRRTWVTAANTKFAFNHRCKNVPEKNVRNAKNVGKILKNV